MCLERIEPPRIPLRCIRATGFHRFISKLSIANGQSRFKVGSLEMASVSVLFDDHRDREFFLLPEHFAALFAAPVFRDDIAELQAQQPEQSVTGVCKKRMRQVDLQNAAIRLISYYSKVGDHEPRQA